MNINTKPVLVEFRLVGTNKSRAHYFTQKTPNAQELETYRRL